MPLPTPEPLESEKRASTPPERRVMISAGLKIERRDEGEGPPRIVGYAVVFDSLSEDLGGFRERVRPGAFTNSIREGADVRALVDHDPGKVLGRTKSGTLELRTTAKGLLTYITPPNTTIAKDIMESINRGDVDGMSFGFRTITDEWHDVDGQPIRDLVEAELFDVSVVTFPAYPATEVGLRSFDVWKQHREAVKAEQERLRQRLKQLQY